MENSFRKNITPLIENNMNKESENKLTESILHYIDRNNKVLFDIGPTYRLLFSDIDKKLIFDTSGIDESIIKEAVKNSQYTGSAWKIATNPFNVLCTMMIRHFLIQNNTKAEKLCLMYLSLHLYSSIHFKYFKYEPEVNIMEYTVNHLNNKYLIKQLGSLMKAIDNTAMTSHETYSKALKKGDDRDIVYYINALKTRLDGLIKNIANEFYDNHKNKRYLNFDSDSMDEDNYHIADSDTFALTRETDKITLKMMTNGADMNLVKIASEWNKVSELEIRNTVVKLLENDEDAKKVRTMVNRILELFIIEYRNNPKYIKTNKFLYECLQIYKKSNTNDKSIIEIKSILDDWLKKGSKTYVKTKRDATLSDFRKALYVFFVLSIQSNSLD